MPFTARHHIVDKLDLEVKMALEKLLRIDQDRTWDKRVLPERFHEVNAM